METQQYVPSLVADVDVVVHNISVFSAAMETTMDSLGTVIDLQNIACSNSMKYYRSVSLYLPKFSGVQIASFMCRIILLSVACLALPYVSTFHYK